MKKLLTISLVISALSASAQVPHSVTVRPGPSQAKNASIWKEMNAPNATDENIIAESWTAGGDVTLRSAFYIAPPALPSNATFVSAFITLYGNVTSGHTQGHSSYPGAGYGTTNEAWLQRITSPWTASTATWSNLPPTTVSHAVSMLSSTAQHQNYVIDVSQMVKDMLDTPSKAYGFMLSMQNETPYRALIFGSSYHPDSNYRPQLTINYTTPTPAGVVAVASADVNVYPNPAINQIQISFLNGHNAAEVTLTDIAGRIALKKSYSISANGQALVNVAELPRGSYFLRINSVDNSKAVRMITLQ